MGCTLAKMQSVEVVSQAQEALRLGQLKSAHPTWQSGKCSLCGGIFKSPIDKAGESEKISKNLLGMFKVRGDRGRITQFLWILATMGKIMCRTIKFWLRIMLSLFGTQH